MMERGVGVESWKMGEMEEGGLVKLSEREAVFS